MELPLYFPKDMNRRLVGLQDPHRKKQSIVFQDFGRFGHVDVEFPDWNSDVQSSHSQPTYIAQRQHDADQDRSHLCAQIPTLPLSDTPTKVHYPVRDCVINDLPERQTRVKTFSRSLKQVTASVTGRAMWHKKFLAGKQTLDRYSHAYKISPIQRQAIEENLPDTIRQLINEYSDLSQQPCFNSDYNPRYSGGLLSCVADSSRNTVDHLLFHASGRKLQRLVMTQATPSDSHIFASQVLAESKVKAIYQVNAQSVHDQVFIGTRHEDSCTVFCLRGFDRQDAFHSVQPGSSVEFVQIGTYSSDSKDVPTSLCISPYLPGEGLFCSDGGTVCTWSADSGVLRTMERSWRFPCDDPWRHVHYASHPRHIVVTDRTCVQMLDHRDGFRSSVDLFALPNKLVHGKERIMSSHHHGNTSPLHSVATSHCLFLVDQRFASTPVLQLYPDLAKPVVYLASTDYAIEGGGEGGVLLAGSQHPAEAVCYPFTQGSKHAVTMPLNPWRLSKTSDICNTGHYSCFFTSGDLSCFQERLGVSLAGLAVAPGARAESIVCYQADCYGEIYFQQYSKPDNPRLVRKTGVSAPGQRDHHVPSEVQAHVKLWVQRLQEQIDSMKQLQKRSQLLRQETPGMDFCASNLEALSSVPVAISCCSYCGDYEDILSSDDSSEENKLVCPSCRLHLHTSGINSPPLLQPPGGGASATRPFCAFDADLWGIAPAVESLACDLHDPEANTMVLMELMKDEAQPELTDLVEKREDERSQLLKDLKEKHQLAREEKKRRKQDALNDRGLTMVDVSQPSPTHSVFNSEEHQRQNALIVQVLAEAQSTSSARPVTIGKDAGDGGSLGSQSDSELFSESDHFHSDSGRQDEAEAAAEMPASLSLTQDDDDDFFSACEDTPPKTEAVVSGLKFTAVKRKEGKSLSLSQHDESSDLFSSDEDTGPLPCASQSVSQLDITDRYHSLDNSAYALNMSQVASGTDVQFPGADMIPSPRISVLSNFLSQAQHSPNGPPAPQSSALRRTPLKARRTISTPESRRRSLMLTTGDTRTAASPLTRTPNVFTSPSPARTPQVLSAGQSSSVLTAAEVNTPAITSPQLLKSKSVDTNYASPLARSSLMSPPSTELRKTPDSKGAKKSARRSLVSGF